MKVATVSNERRVRVLQSTANGLTVKCPVHKNATKNVPCYSSSPFICAKRRAKFRITEPGRKTVVTLLKESEREPTFIGREWET